MDPYVRSLSSKECAFAWNDVGQEDLSWLENADHASDRGKAERRSYRIGNSALVKIRDESTEIIRDEESTAQPAAGRIRIIWLITGEMLLKQRQKQTAIESGQAYVCDTSWPYRVELSDGGHYLAFTMPDDAVPEWERIGRKVRGRVLSNIATLRAALSSLLAVLRTPQVGGSEDAECVFRAVQWMIGASLTNAVGPEDECDRAAARFKKVRQHILDNMDDPNLNPDGLATALHMSRRALYMLLSERQMTPAKMIQRLRLERCHKALADPKLRMRSITEIAFASGFGDCATFSRLFKAQYGLSPRDWRSCYQKSGGVNTLPCA